MRKQKSEPTWKSSWGNHILNAVVISFGLLGLGYFLKAWEIPLFWVLGGFAITFAFLFDRIPNRYRWLKVTIILTIPVIIITLAKAGIGQFLLVDLGIFIVALELIEYFKSQRKRESQRFIVIDRNN